MSKIVFVEERTTVSNSGEVFQQEKTKILKMPKEPPYVKMYLDDISSIFRLKKGASDLLYELVRRIDFEGMIALNSYIKKGIAGRLDCKMQTIDNNLQKLIREKIIIRVGLGSFEVNPNLFAKGEWHEIYKRRNNGKFKLEITYNGNERSIKGSVDDSE